MSVEQQTGPTAPAPSSGPPDVPEDPNVPNVAPAVAAQLLATEHWSLLAARSTMWSEVMSRITIHLTVASASLVLLALVAQATDFGPAFRALSVGLTSVVLVLGTLTGIRVHLASHEDAGLVLGMNRLRAGYLELVPGLDRYLVTSTHDDQPGLMHTYTLGMGRNTLVHVIGSTNMFVMVVNVVVAGTWGWLVSDAAGWSTVVAVVVGVACAAAYLVAFLVAAARTFGGRRLDVRFPSSRTG